MFGLDPKAARITWTAFLVALAIYIVYLSAHTIVVFALALFLSHLLKPAVAFIDRWTPARIPHAAAIAIAYLRTSGFGGRDDWVERGRRCGELRGADA